MKTLFGRRFYSTKKSKISFDGFCELKKGSFVDTIFLNLFSFDLKKDINLSIDVVKLRGLAYALLDNDCDFKFYTESGGFKNEISIKENAGKGWFINATVTNTTSKDKTLSISFLLGKYGMFSFVKTIKVFCDELEKFVYVKQQEDALMYKENKPSN